MSMLIMGDQEKRELQRIREHAKHNVFSFDDLLDRKNDPDMLVPGDYPEFSTFIPMHFKVVFSMEEQPKGLTRHVSIGYEPYSANKAPNPQVVELIMKELGFTGDLADAEIGLEELDHGVINVYELIDKDSYV